METSPAGLAVLALFVLWLGFWVPHRLRHRQQLLESRVDDRFSGGLRVLAVAGPGGARGVTTPTGGSVPLLVPGATSDGGRGERPMGLDDDRGASRALTDPRATSREVDRPRESRLALLEQRAARARRRLLLTVLLLLVTAAAWVVVALGPVGWYAGAVPSALLLVVLVLGRVAVLQARRADARWAADRKTARQQATQARALANGGPHAPRNRARVTGHAVRPSTTHTQMIPRVTVAADQHATARADRRASRTTASPAPAVPSVPSASSSRVAVDEARGDESAEPEPAGVRRPTNAGREVFDVGADEPTATPEPVVVVDPGPGAPAGPPPVGSDPWEPVPVPLPTYVTKPAAPRREPRPLAGPTAAGRVPPAPDRGAALAATMHAALGPTATPAGAPDADRAPGTVRATSPGADVSVGDEPRPRTETLGLPLDEILARRRAAG
ncbi:hypothetical protein M1843_13505 [Isoptericola sp. 4D.3]|uniref:Uncharacterized protein n=1 Tax=Isoptericola peretonis TaxID=2918523 RepID=A0ABT0J5M6_9MICO|nr:hypothetical protein [Isoptericola sp. 4D.3]